MQIKFKTNKWGKRKRVTYDIKQLRMGDQKLIHGIGRLKNQLGKNGDIDTTRGKIGNKIRNL